jgi:hypothetical protein
VVKGWLVKQEAVSPDDKYGEVVVLDHDVGVTSFLATYNDKRDLADLPASST